MSEFVVIVTTTDDRKIADAIADAVIARRLAACARISSAESVYRWEGELCRSSEFVVEIKTAAAAVAAAQDAIRGLHNYELPEIVVLPILGGSEAYLGWMREAVSAEER